MAQRSIRTTSKPTAKKKPKKIDVKYNWKIAILTSILVVLSAYVYMQFSNAARPTGEAIYETQKLNATEARRAQGLRKVKKNASHPCAGAYEVQGRRDIKGKIICTTPGEGLTTGGSTATTQKLQAKARSLAPISNQSMIDSLKSTGTPPADPTIASEYTAVGSASASIAEQGASPVVPSTPNCYGTGMDGKRIVIIAAGTKDKPITDQDKALIQTAVGQMESTLIWNSYTQNPDKVMHWRFFQGSDCKPIIITATQAADYYNDLSVFTYASLHQDSGIAAAANSASQMADGQGLIPHFLVFTRSGGNACGQSDFNTGGGLENSSAFSFVYGATPTDRSGTQCWNGFVALHETMHAKGAVDFTSPHTTLFGHCFDEKDLMCYDDRGGAVPMQNICPATSFDDWRADYLLDCNADDYFSVKPDADAVFNPNWWLGQTGLVHYNTAKSGFMTNLAGQTSINQPDRTAPAGPTTLNAASYGSTQVNLSWPAATDNVGVTQYILYRDGVQIYAGTNLSFSNTGLTAGTSYTFQIKAKDAANNLSTGASATVTMPQVAPNTTVPTVPPTTTVLPVTNPAAKNKG